MRTAFVVAVVVALGAAGCGGKEPSNDSGGKIAFAGGECCGDGLMPLDIWVMNDDGSDARRLTEDPRAERDPSWSPDGNRLVFKAGDGVAVVDADGGNRRQVAENGIHPIWSPRDDVIAFARDDGSSYVINADGSGLRRVGAGIPADWHPDGSKLGVLRDTQIYLSEVEGSGGREISRDEEGYQDADWSPDGELIAFTSARGTSIVTVDVYVMNADGTGERRLTKFGNADGDCYYGPIRGLDWSPDGDRIAFAVSFVGCKKVGDIYTVKPDGSDLTRLTDSGFAVDPAWRPES